MLNLFTMNYSNNFANLVWTKHTENKIRIFVFKNMLMTGGVLPFK